MILLDSNIIIYAHSPEHKSVVDFLRGQEIYVSVLTQIEVMGYWRISELEYLHFEEFFANLNIIGITPEISGEAVRLRRKRNVSLADAVIAATALTLKMPLVTHNVEDFKWIESLTIIDPLQEE